MAKTSAMRLVELMVLKQDIAGVIHLLGKRKNFQFETDDNAALSDDKNLNTEHSMYERLQQGRLFLGMDDCGPEANDAELPTLQSEADANQLLSKIDELRTRVVEKEDELKRIKDAHNEAVSFSNLKVAYSELEHLSFLSLRIGKIDPAVFDELRFAVGAHAVVIPLGQDNSRILAASSKKGRFALDTELKRFGFVAMEIPHDFKGIPDEVLTSLAQQLQAAEKAAAAVDEERKNFAITHADSLHGLLASYSIGMQVKDVQSTLESTQLVYRITGWLPESECHDTMKSLSELTDNRIAVRIYMPYEVPSVASGHEKVPVKLHHGKLIGAFERMIFSYGSPVYGSIDPTPFVALFFTLLFGIMFGDAGQGAVFLIAGILMAYKVINVGGWNKFAPVFMAIGVSSMIMGFLTGEVFTNTTLLLPASRFVKGLFGITDPVKLSEPILSLMPSAERISTMFLFFGFTVAVGFVINSIGILINIINQFSLKHPGHALFGKAGISGAFFFWYVVVMALRMVFFHHAMAVYDWIIICVTLIASAFGEPLARFVEHDTPVLADGLGTTVIEGLVEILEVASTYFSNSVSFLRVGAFALAHAVLGFIIMTMSALAPSIGGVIVFIVGNVIVIVLEGMIVAIQVIRLQYYEFFSKFFNETGREFKPFTFEYSHV